MIDIRTGKHFTTPSARSQMTRGGFLRGGIASIIAAKSAPYIAVSSAVLAGSANGGVARGMMRGVGAWNAAIGGGGWKNPYITDGLVLMTDGEWINGPKDISQSEWDGTVHDLISGNSITLYNGGFWDKSNKQYGWAGSLHGGSSSTNLELSDQSTPSAFTCESVCYGSGVGSVSMGDIYPICRPYLQFAILRAEGSACARTRLIINGLKSSHFIWVVQSIQQMTTPNLWRVVCKDTTKESNTLTCANGSTVVFHRAILPSYITESKIKFMCGSYDSNSTCYVKSVRVYNRVLTQAEQDHNHFVDQLRFGIA